MGKKKNLGLEFKCLKLYNTCRLNLKNNLNSYSCSIPTKPEKINKEGKHISGAGRSFMNVWTFKGSVGFEDIP